MRDRFGPAPAAWPSIRWQLRQPLSWKSRAPSATGPLVAPTTAGGSGGASKFGDHGERAPTIQSEPIITHRQHDDADRPRPPPRAALALVRQDAAATNSSAPIDERRARMTTCLELRRAEREHGEVPEQVPVGPRLGVDEARVGRLAERRAGRRASASSTMPAIIATPKTTSRHAASGQNGTPSFFRQLLVLLAVGLRVDRLARLRRLGDAVAHARATGAAPTNTKMHRRDEEHVDREEAAQRRAADGVAAEDEARDRGRR